MRRAPADRPVALNGLAGRTWPQLDGAAPLLVVPLGSLEQHGPHLPLATDGIIADAVVHGVVARLAERGVVAVAAPPVWYGASGEHEDFPGTVSIGHDALRLLLVECARSACRWARGVVMVNGHGGNVAALADAADLLRSEGRRVLWTGCAPPADGDAHAGRTETSLLLHLRPEAVRTDRSAAGADIGQIDEPYLQARPEPARAYGLAAVNAALDGITGTTAVHLCFGYAAIIHERPEGYSFLPELAACPTKQISIETAQSGLDLGVLADLSDKTIILGVIDLSTPEVEPADLVARRTERAFEYLPPEQIVIAPDCGMKYLPRDSAAGKLRAMSAAAQLLRAAPDQS